MVSGRLAGEQDGGKMVEFDFIVIGGGMAGASAAYELSGSSRVLGFAQEHYPGYPRAARSAALYAETYGTRTIRGLTTGGKAFYLDPPPGFTEHPLLRPRGVMFVGRADQQAALDRFLAEVAGLRSNIRRIEVTEAYAHAPVLCPGYVAGA